MLIDSAFAKDKKNLQDSDVSLHVTKEIHAHQSSVHAKQTESESLWPENRGKLPEVSENGHKIPKMRSADNIRPSSPGPAIPPQERGRENVHGKKENDWKDLAQRLLFSETKCSSTGRLIRDFESKHTKFELDPKNHSPQKAAAYMKQGLVASNDRPMVKSRGEQSLVSPNGPMNITKDFILFNPVHVAAAKERLGMQKQTVPNLSISVLTPPPGLELSLLGGSQVNTSKVLHNILIKCICE